MRSFKPKAKGNETATEAKNNDVLPHGDHKEVKSKVNRGKFTCLIRLLDDFQKPLKCTITKEDSGQVVFYFLCRTIGDLAERDYFGLRYRDKYDQEQWIDLTKSVYKQLKRSKNQELCFRLKHYPADPVRDLKQNLTRYLVYLQIRRDLLHGRLACPPSMMADIGALIAQAELGDPPETVEATSGEKDEISESESQNQNTTESEKDENFQSEDQNQHTTKSDSLANYLQGLQIFSTQTTEDELAIMKKHEKLRGITAQEAEAELLNYVSNLPTYGIVPFPVKPHYKIDLSDVVKSSSEEINSSKAEKKPQAPSNDRKFNLGINAEGLIVFLGLKKVQEIPWADIHRLTCEGKQFIVHLNKEKPNLFKRLLRSKHKHLTFDCESSAAALALWRWAVDRQCFFTLKESKQAVRLRPNSSLFHRNRSYRFSGRSFLELSAAPIKNTQSQFTRVSSLRIASTPDNALPKHATLPSRLRPVLNMAEEEQVLDTMETDERASTAVVSMEEGTKKMTPCGIEKHEGKILDENGITEKILISSSVAATQQASPPLQNDGADSNMPLKSESCSLQCSVPVDDSDQDHSDLRNRVDSDLIQSLVYKQVVSEMVENHADPLSDAVMGNKATIPNGEIPRKGDASKCVNGSAKSNGKSKKLDNATDQDSEQLSKHSGYSPDVKVSIALAVFVLVVGAIVVLETSANGTSPASRFLRSNLIISAIDEYIYTPVRDLVTSGLSLFWS